MSAVRIFLDFDGTISETDSLKWVLDEFGGARWRRIEAELLGGRISEARALERAFEVFPYSPEFIWNEVKDRIRIDPSFVTFYRWARGEGYQLEVLSGGFTSWIEASLKAVDIDDLPIKANSFIARAGGWKIVSAPAPRLCELCHHCKTSSVLSSRARQNPAYLVYVGDGHTDRCPVSLADLIFAKKSLARYCGEMQLPFESYETFADVTQALQRRLTQKDFSSSFRIHPSAQAVS